MLAEPGFTQHLAGIATNRYGNSCLKIMMVIKGEPMWKFGDTAFVICDMAEVFTDVFKICLLYTSPSPRDRTRSRMPSSA